RMAIDPEVLLAHRDFVSALARQLVRGDRADDVAQETWLAALERRPATDRSPKPWLAAVARNVARLLARGDRRPAPHQPAAAPGALPGAPPHEARRNPPPPTSSSARWRGGASSTPSFRSKSPIAARSCSAGSRICRRARSRAAPACPSRP